MHPIQQINFNIRNQAYVIEASAGTGKTWTIERLFVKAILTNHKLNLKNFLVVTFTKNATNELKERILRFIKEVILLLTTLKNSPNDNKIDDILIHEIIHLNIDINKCISVLNSVILNFDQASIYTIHGFYKKILTRYQFDINVTPNFTLNGQYKQTLYAELIRKFFRTQIFNNETLANQYNIIDDNLKSIIKNNHSADDYVATLTKIFTKNKIIIFKNKRFCLNYEVMQHPNLAILTTIITKPTKAKTTKKKQPTQDTDTVTNVNLNIIKYNLFSAIANYIAYNFNLYMLKENVLDFDDIVAILSDATNSNQQLNNELFNDYPIVFIDEFQDTDTLQWNIFNNIYKLSTPQKRGMVIVVGDPKQAVYKFRGADINAYIYAKNIINNTLTLTNNYRSHPNILNFINCLFSSHYNPNCFGNKIEFSSVLAKKNQQDLYQLPDKNALENILKQNKIAINNETNIYNEHVQIITITANNKESRQKKIINAIGYEILLLLKSDITLIDKIAILVPQNEQAVSLKNELNKYGIKLNINKKPTIFETQTAKDLLTILKATLDLSNQRLFRLAIATNLFNIPYSDLAEFISISTQIFKTQNIAECFFNYKKHFNNNKILSLIYLLINDLNAIYLFYNNKIYNRELANLIQLGEIIENKCSHISSPHEIIFWLTQKINKVTYLNNDESLDIDEECEELVRLDTDEKQIQIITQHKAKGLEFDIVFCPYFKENIYSITELKAIAENNKNDDEVEFINYTNETSYTQYHKLTNNPQEILQANLEENQEITRLNYVSLTRAKSRLYIYLSNIKINNDGINYHGQTKPPLLYNLLGFNYANATDNTHALFNYTALFTDPINAIKLPNVLPSVSIYTRNIDTNILTQLKLEDSTTSINSSEYPQDNIEIQINLIPTFFRQSYSSLARISHNNALTSLYDEINNIDIPNNLEPTTIEYNYELLNQYRGTNFGVMVHSLCENYPINEQKVNKILSNSNISSQYTSDAIHITNQIFNYPIINNAPLHMIKNKINEFEFNLKINNPTQINHDIKLLFAKYYGSTHPYTKECNKLDIIQHGFLTGFIDVFFEYENKYYILDYKTNSLDNYKSCNNIFDTNNFLLNNTAKNLYHVQYIIYLIAIKRYLEHKLNIPNASNLLGGAVYYYIRGLFVKDTQPSGILFDKVCIQLVDELDLILKKTRGSVEHSNIDNDDLEKLWG